MHSLTMKSLLAASLFWYLGAIQAAFLEDVITEAEQAFGGVAFAAETYRGVTEIKILAGNQIIEAQYNTDTGLLIDSEIYGRQRLVQRVSGAIDQAALSLAEAVNAAHAAVGQGDFLEIVLLTSRRNSGRYYLVDMRTADGVFDIVLDSTTGNVIRIVRD
jgi:uncharacterized membrane protein YkoI